MIAKRSASAGRIGPGRGTLPSVLWLLAPFAIALAAPGSNAWQPLHFPGIDRHTSYDVVETEWGPAFRALATCAASAMLLELPELDLTETPRLRWRWRVETGLALDDERTRDGDDFAARVYVLFPFDSAGASLWDRLRRAIASRLYGRPLPGRALNYVWASRVLPGTRWTNPFSEDALVIARRTGSAEAEGGGWQTEVVDLPADYRAWMDEAPPAPLALAIMSDSDNACRRSAALFADFAFLPAAALEPVAGTGIGGFHE